jgi:competence transcription factor ComK
MSVKPNIKVLPFFIFAIYVLPVHKHVFEQTNQTNWVNLIHISSMEQAKKRNMRKTTPIYVIRLNFLLKLHKKEVKLTHSTKNRQQQQKSH